MSDLPCQLLLRWSDPFVRQASVPRVADDAKCGVGNSAPEADDLTYVLLSLLVPPPVLFTLFRSLPNTKKKSSVDFDDDCDPPPTTPIIKNLVIQRQPPTPPIDVELDNGADPS